MASSCDINPGLEDMDQIAATVAYDYIYRNQTTYIDSVYLPQQQSVRFKNAISAVINLESERTDSIFEYYDFHFPRASLRSISITVSKTIPWYLNLRNDTSAPTGYTPFDDLMSAYDLSVATIYEFADLLNYHTVHLEADTFLNSGYLATLFDTLDGVYYSSGSEVSLDGDYIQGQLFEDYVSLLFSVGEGDCPSGCMFRYFWEFRVYEDCSVEFMGNNRDITSTFENGQTETSFKVYPNPFQDRFVIEAPQGINFRYELYNMSGQLVTKGSGFGRTILQLDKTPLSGIYVLKLLAGDTVFTRRIVKK